MNGGIYLLQDSGDLVEMRETRYDSERVLQELLAKYPNLLAGDQIDSSVPRRWLFISREMRLRSEEDGAERWSVDHFLLDQDAIPTFVEVKRSSDTRIRREVVGQMLDYAANAVIYLSIDVIRDKYVKNYQDADDPVSNLEHFLDGEAEEEFWQKAKTNLQAGKIRLVFVADEIPPELRRIVEFLNRQMDPAQVLAVEIKQYLGSGMKTLVPRVVGLTARGDSQPSQKKHLYLDYWQAFIERLQSSHFLANPTTRSVLQFKLNKPKLSLVAYLETARPGNIWVGFRSADKDSWKPLQVESLRQLIQEKLDTNDTKLEWEEDTAYLYAGFYLPASPPDRGDWRRQHEWLQKNLKRLHEVFAPLTETLEHGNEQQNGATVASTEG